MSLYTRFVIMIVDCITRDHCTCSKGNLYKATNCLTQTPSGMCECSHSTNESEGTYPVLCGLE